MPDISKITLPSGTTYDLKDAQARTDIASIQSSIAGGVSLIGQTTTELTDGATTTTITVNGQSHTASKGNIVYYGTEEFLYDGTKWIALGDLSTIGALGYKDSATGSFTPAGNVSLTNANQTVPVSEASSGTATYTPAGTVAPPTISVSSAGSTTTVNSITDVGTLPSLTTSVTNETLTIGFSQGTLPTKGADTTVKTGDASYEATAPTFTGTGARLVTGNISVPSSASFSGTTSTVTVT